jgi:ribosomal protein S27AE
MTPWTTRMIVSPTIWVTSDLCPDCGATVTMADDGRSSVRAECHSCGYADTWTTDRAAGGDQ